MAKSGRDAESWKRYRKALRKDKERWMADRLDKACEDWAVYKSLTRGKKGWGEEYMASTTDGNPIHSITQHFKGVFHDEERTGDMREMETLRQGIDTSGHITEFTVEEVADAMAKGKRGKAVGADQIPTELLQGLVKCEESLGALTRFYNEILRTGDPPQDWDRSIATLLPKASPPTQPKELRPITLAGKAAS